MRFSMTWNYLSSNEKKKERWWFLPQLCGFATWWLKNTTWCVQIVGRLLRSQHMFRYMRLLLSGLNLCLCDLLWCGLLWLLLLLLRFVIICYTCDRIESYKTNKIFQIKINKKFQKKTFQVTSSGFVVVGIVVCCLSLLIIAAKYVWSGARVIGLGVGVGLGACGLHIAKYVCGVCLVGLVGERLLSRRRLLVVAAKYVVWTATWRIQDSVAIQVQIDIKFFLKWFFRLSKSIPRWRLVIWITTEIHHF